MQTAGGAGALKGGQARGRGGGSSGTGGRGGSDSRRADGRGKHGGSKGKAVPPKLKVSTTKREEAEVKQLEARIAAELPPPGSTETDFKRFEELPLSKYTLTGLQRAKYVALTQVQRIAIPHALAGYVPRRSLLEHRVGWCTCGEPASRAIPRGFGALLVLLFLLFWLSLSLPFSSATCQTLRVQARRARRRKDGQWQDARYVV
jgi:hypothetical protein